MNTISKKPSGGDFFTSEIAAKYDHNNGKLSVLQNSLHFLIDLVLAKLPSQAHILCVGAGTGAEILALAHQHPNWTFTAVDPSPSMLDICRERLNQAGLSNKCTFIEGYVSDAPEATKFDAVLSIFVSHFIPQEERADYYQNIHNRLKSGGYFISSEISYDLNSDQFPSMLENWKQIQTLMGATPETLQKLPDMLKNTLSILPPETTENLINAAGFDQPIPFFQNFMIRGWYAVK